MNLILIHVSILFNFLYMYKHIFNFTNIYGSLQESNRIVTEISVTIPSQKGFSDGNMAIIIFTVAIFNDGKSIRHK